MPHRAVGRHQGRSRWFQQSHRHTRYVYLRLTRLRSSPTALARGFAAGTVTRRMPLFGVQTLFAVGLATLVRGNPLATAVTTWVSNPFTFAPLYMMNFKVGQQFLGTQDLMLSLQSDTSILALSRLGLDCLLTLTVGCIATGLPLAFVSYCGWLTNGSVVAVGVVYSCSN
ncbi:MAG: DUF2062 domain-containing protein [Leptolyngbya sp. SIOISBB]|nr:DUF2062 domain-containing protein [Leptolyngbya sp. SIOISBB]